MRSAACVSASVAVSVATAVWFSSAVKLVAPVMTGPLAMTFSVSSWYRPAASVTRSVNAKVVVSVNAAGMVKVAVAALAFVSVTPTPSVCVQA